MVRDQIGRFFMTIESKIGRDLCVIVNGFSISDLLVKWIPFVSLLFVDLLMTVNELEGALSLSLSLRSEGSHMIALSFEL